MRPIEISYELDDRLIRSSLREIEKRSFLLTVVPGLVIVAVLASSASIILDHLGFIDFLASCCYASLFMLFAFQAYWWWRNLQSWRHFRSLPHCRVRCRLTPNGIELDDAMGQAKVTWAIVGRVWRMRTLWVFWSGFYDYQIAWLPASSLSDKARQLINEKTRRTRKENLFKCTCCRHTLIGMTTRVCAKCSKPIPFEEMGLSLREFRALSVKLSKDRRNSLNAKLSKVYLLPQANILSTRLIVLMGILVALAAFIVSMPGSGIFVTSWRWTALPVVGLLCLRIERWRTLLAFATSYSATFGALFLILLQIAVAADPTIEFDIWTILLLMLGWPIIPPFLVNIVLGSLIWLVLGLFVGTPVPSGFFYCAQCAYGLFGSDSDVCTECGTPIDYQAMGMTRERFREIAQSLRETISPTPQPA